MSEREFKIGGKIMKYSKTLSGRYLNIFQYQIYWYWSETKNLHIHIISKRSEHV